MDKSVSRLELKESPDAVLGPKPKAVIYVRVSSAAQVAKGQGAESQAARCTEFAKQRGYEVVKTFEDRAVSGSLTDRPGIEALLAYVRQHRCDNIRVLIDDISRLARGVITHIALRAAIQKAGGVLESPSREYGVDPEDDVLEIIEAVFSGEARRKNAEQTRNRMEARLRQGYWPFIPPLGFVTKRIEGHGKVMVRDEPLASIVQEALEGYASGRFQTQAEVKRFLESQPDFPKTRYGTVTNETANRILTRLVYAGMVERPEWGVSRRKGKHEGLISYETYLKIQDRLAGKAYAPTRSDLNTDFPLRGSVTCGSCDNPLTANWSKSKTGKKHPYYMCFKKGCPDYRKSIRRAEIEGQFEILLGEIKPAPKLFAIAKAMFSDAWEQYARIAEYRASRLKAKISKIDQDLSTLLDRIVSASTDSVIKAYEAKIEALESEKLLATEQLGKSSRPSRTFEEMFELTMAFLANPQNLWKSDRFEDKQTTLKLLFAGPLTYDRNGGFRTPKTANIFSMLGDKMSLKMTDRRDR